jgi:hypothetical protein
MDQEENQIKLKEDGLYILYYLASRSLYFFLGHLCTIAAKIVSSPQEEDTILAICAPSYNRNIDF